VLAFSPQLGAVQKVALADNADDSAIVGDHRKTTDMSIEHDGHDLAKRGFRANRDDTSRHDVSGLHRSISLTSELTRDFAFCRHDER
jgi:hypothetical protein